MLFIWPKAWIRFGFLNRETWRIMGNGRKPSYLYKPTLRLALFELLDWSPCLLDSCTLTKATCPPQVCILSL